MKFIDSHFSISHSFQSTGFLVWFLMLLTFISFSGAVSPVSAQGNGNVCRQTKEEIQTYEMEKRQMQQWIYFKNNERLLRDQMSAINNKIANGTLLSIDNLETLAANLKLRLPRQPAEMSIEERQLYQSYIRDSIVYLLNEMSKMKMEQLEQKLERLEGLLMLRRERLNALGCGEVLNETITPDLLRQCETYDGTVCGTWKLERNQYHATWDNGAKAVMDIERFTNDKVTFTRKDSTDSVSNGFTALYTGTISGNKITGTVTWSNGNRTWSGTWEASW